MEIFSPPPPTTDITPLPHSTASVKTLCTATCRAGLRPAPKQMALDRMAACQSWICSPCCKSCVYGICAFVLRCFFFCSQTVLQMEHSLGVKNFFFPPLSPHVKSCIFLNTLSPVLSTPLSYVCCVCMDRLMANFAGTCTSDNKGLLLHKASQQQPTT